MEMDIFSFIQEYAVLPVAAVCFLLGWLLKNTFSAFPDKYIPVALVPAGLVGVLWLNAWAFTPDNVLAGICSAALAVLAHQTGKQLIVKTESDKAEPGGVANE